MSKNRGIFESKVVLVLTRNDGNFSKLSLKAREIPNLVKFVISVEKGVLKN